MGKYLFAIIFVTISLSGHSQSANFAFQQGEDLMEKQQYDDAIAKFKYVLRKDPYYYEAYYDLGIISLKTGKKEEAYTNFGMAIKTNSNYTEAYEQHILLAKELKKYKEGLTDCNQLIRLNSKKADYYANRADFYKALQKDDKAYSDLLKAISLKTQNPDTYYQAALMAKKKKNDADFLKFISQVLQLKPTYADALYLRGSYYYNHQDTGKANTDLIKVYSVDHTTYGKNLPKMLGEIAFHQKNYKQALVYYNDIIKTYHSKDAKIWIRKALCQKAQKHYPEAVKTLNRAAAYDRTNPEIFIERALINDKMGKTQMAKTDFTKAINLDKKNPLPYYRRGLYYLNKKKFDAAIADLTMAIKYNKKPPANYFFYRGSCYFATHQKDKACEDLTKAAELGNKKAEKTKSEICY